MATKEQLYKVLVDSNPNFGKVDMDTAFKAAGNMNPAWRDAVAKVSIPITQPTQTNPELAYMARKSQSAANIIKPAVETLAKPSVALPLVAGALSGGAGVLPTSALVALTAAGGKGYEIASEDISTGKIKPALEATKDMAIDGLVAGGLDALTGGIAKAMPFSKLKSGYARLTEYLLKTRPFKATARAIGRGEKVDLSLGKNAIERSLSKNIEGLQKVIEYQRSTLGKVVKSEGEKLASATSGTEPINIKDVVNEIENELKTISMTPGAGEQVAKSGEAKRLLAMLSSFKDGRMSVADAIRNKRYIDSVMDYPITSAKPTEMGLLEPLFKKLRKGIGDELIDTAESLGQKSYLQANKKYGDYMNWYKTDGQAVFSSQGGEKAMGEKIKKMGGVFKDIGIKGGVIENSKNFLPKWTHTNIDKLQDDLSAGFFANLMESTPSGSFKDLLKLVAYPTSKLGVRALSKSIPIAQSVKPIVSPLPGPFGVMVTESYRNNPNVKK